jgi:thiamine-phosphate pyrophosphorylase
MIAGLYAIADSGWNPFASLPELAEKFLKGGCRLIQLRMKSGRGSSHESRVTSPEMLAVARQIMRLKERFDFTFIINDHADIALEIGADGVHVGENDEPVASLRKRVGRKLLIGYSSHSIEEAQKAVCDGADYVAFGAIFPTKTKGPGHPVQGIPRLRELVKSVGVPVVAIGGINRENISQVIEAGAQSVAMITALSQAPDVSAETRWFVERI